MVLSSVFYLCFLTGTLQVRDSLYFRDKESWVWSSSQIREAENVINGKFRKVYLVQRSADEGPWTKTGPPLVGVNKVLSEHSRACFPVGHCCFLTITGRVG